MPSTSAKPPPEGEEDAVVFTVNENCNMQQYKPGVSECTVLAYYLSIMRPFQLHEFTDALDWQNMSDENFDNILIYSLPKMLGNPNAVDSVLTCEEDTSQHRCSEIMNKFTGLNSLDN